MAQVKQPPEARRPLADVAPAQTRPARGKRRQRGSESSEEDEGPVIVKKQRSGVTPVNMPTPPLGEAAGRRAARSSPGRPTARAARGHTLVPPKVSAASYALGALVQVDLTNFQVSQSASFRFAPGLNMIIGPNGSGKSTVITAVFLIFQGARGDLSRTKMSEFVRNGSDSGRASLWFRVDGEGFEGSGLCNITLHIDKDNNYRYEVDGKGVTPNEIKALAERHNIQVNNTCQFLPQERVSAFSAQTMHERLQSTLESVGEASMIETLKQLIELGEHVREWSDKAGANDELIEQLGAELTDLSAKVQQLKEIEENQKDLESLKSIEQLSAYNAVRSDLRRLKAQLAEIRKSEQEFLANNDDLITTKAACESTAAAKSKAVRDIEAKLLEQSATIKAAIGTIRREIQASSMAAVNSQQQEYDLWKEGLKRARSRVDDLRRNVEAAQEKFDPAALLEAHEAHTKLKDEAAAVEAEHDALRSGVLSDQAQMARHELESNRASDELKEFRKGRISQAQNRQDLQAGLDLVRENRARFKGRVLEPALLSISVKQGYEKQVASTVQISQLQTFICNNHDDWILMNNLFKGKCRCRIMEIDPNAAPRSLPRGLVDSLGLDGVVSDLISDTPEMMTALNELFSYNLVPYAKGDLPAQTVQRVRQDPNLGHLKLMVDARSVYRFSRSRYGNKQTSLQSSSHHGQQWPRVCYGDLRAARKRVDASRERIKANLSELKERIDARNAELAAMSDRREEAQSAAKDAKKTVQKLENFKRQYEDYRRQLSEAERTMAGAESGEAERTRARREAAEKMCDAFSFVGSSELVKLVTAMRLLTQQRDVARVAMLEAEAGAERIEYDLSEQRQQIKRQINELSDLIELANAEVDKLRPAIRAIKEKLGDEEYLKAERRSQELTPEQVRDQIVALQLSLSLNETGTSYEEARQMHAQVEKRHAALVKAKADAIANFSSQQTLLNSTAPEFEAKAREFVEGISAKFSEFFARLGCQGEVHLNAPPLKFEEWGVEILVSYRADHPLRPLSSRTQSGGEKAVATAVYLMALQGYSKSPFFVVDEINQGMDKVNERLIHRFIVETSGAEDAPQYFLVTPKVLPDLCYNRTMKVLCNNSSPNVSTFDGSAASNEILRERLMAMKR